MAPICNACGNHDRFEVSVRGDQLISFDADDPPEVVDDHTETTDTRCAECGSRDIMFD